MNCPNCRQPIDSVTVRRRIDAEECWAVDWDDGRVTMEYAETDSEEEIDLGAILCRQCGHRLPFLELAYPASEPTEVDGPD